LVEVLEEVVVLAQVLEEVVLQEVVEVVVLIHIRYLMLPPFPLL